MTEPVEDPQVAYLRAFEAALADATKHMPVPPVDGETPDSLHEKAKAKVDRYPAVVAMVAYVVTVVAASFGLDLDVNEVLGVAVLAAPPVIAWVHRRVSPVIKWERGFRRDRRNPEGLG